MATVSASASGLVAEGSNGLPAPLLQEMILLQKKDKIKALELSHEIISGIYHQILGVEHELLTVVKMQQIKSYTSTVSYQRRSI